VARIGRTPRRPVAAEDIRDLQRRTGHGRRDYAGCRAFLLLCFLLGCVSRSSGLSTAAQVRMARAFLRWSRAEAARRAKVGISTVQQIEDAYRGDRLPAGEEESSTHDGPLGARWRSLDRSALRFCREHHGTLSFIGRANWRKATSESSKRPFRRARTRRAQSPLIVLSLA
jgi:hypothetical protein